MENHGTVFATRFKRMRESIEAMKEIWTKSEAEYHGEFVNFDPIMAWPKPVQKPHPPILIGGAYPWSARRVMRYGDGWIPHSKRPFYDDVTEFMPQFHEMAAAAGRDPQSLPVTLWGVPADLDRLKRYRDLGVARVVISLETAAAEKVLPVLDRWEKLTSQVGG